MKRLLKIPTGLAIFITFILSLIAIIIIYPKDILQHCHFISLSLWPTIITSMLPYVMHWSDWYEATENQLKSNERIFLFGISLILLLIPLSYVSFGPKSPNVKWDDIKYYTIILWTFLALFHICLYFLIAKKLLNKIKESQEETLLQDK